jgi:single-strand DNA-binding protein
MAGCVNKVILIGHCGKDPEIRLTQTGGKIVNLSLATSEDWTDKSSGEKKNKTEWHKVVIMNDRIADVVERFVKKGSQVYVEGQLQTRKWTDKDGADRYSTEVVIGKFRGELVLVGGRSGGDAPGGRAGGYPAEGGAAPRREPQGGGDLGEEIPLGPCWQ